MSEVVPVEEKRPKLNSQNEVLSEEFSFTILNKCSSNVKSVYRDVEKHTVKIVTVFSHLCLNETIMNIHLYMST